MKQNHQLPIRVLFYLASIVFIIFSMQGCICKECVGAVSKQRTDRQIIDPYAAHEPNKPESGSAEIAETNDPAPEVTDVPGKTADVGKALSEEDLFIREQENVDRTMLLAKTISKTDRVIDVVNNSRDFSEIDIYKIIAVRKPVAKNCPLGIRSISSQIIAGPNMSFKSSKEGNDAYGNNDHKHKPGAGFQVGIGYNLGFSDKFSVSPSLLLKQNNASEKINYTYTEPGSPGGGESTDKYSYTSLSAPVVANYQVGKQVQVFAGPEFNYLLKASVKSKGGNGSDNKENITKNSVKVGVGVQAGVKYKIPSGDGDSPFGVQLLYEHRISRLNKKNPEGYGSYTSPAWNMKGFQLGVTCSICELMKSRN